VERFGDNQRLNFMVSRARNRGSCIRTMRKTESHTTLRVAV